MSKIQKYLFSTKTMTILLIIFATSIGYATFIENDYDTATAKSLIYEAKWFEILMFWLIILFLLNIKRYKLWSKDKFPLLIFHLAFLFIFLGGGITRYISFEGEMPILERETSNEIISSKSYFKMMIDDGTQRLAYDNHQYNMTYFDRKDSTNSLFYRQFSGEYKFKHKRIILNTFDYIPHAIDTVVKNAKGINVLELVSIGQGGRKTIFIRNGEIKSINGTLVSYNRPMEGTIQISGEGKNLSIISPFEGGYVQMSGQKVGQITDIEKLKEGAGKVQFNTLEQLKFKTLYTINGAQFVVLNSPFKGEILYREGSKFKANEKKLPGAIKAEVIVGEKRDTVTIIGGKGQTNYTAEVKIDGMNISLGYGSKIVKIPFSLRLDRFILDRYPGSSNPSSFESKITVIDEGKEQEHLIYMNNVMDYKGYRFFQSSYFPTENGTILSVNQDRWGTNITYIGYFMLFIGMFMSLFWRGTRFMKLNTLLKDLNKNKIGFLIPMFLISNLTFSQNTIDDNDRKIDINESLNKIYKEKDTYFELADGDELAKNVRIPDEHAEKFGHLLIQDIEGRIKPVNTQSLEILRKVYKKENFHGLSSDKWFISLQLDPAYWAKAPMIKIGKKGGNKLKKITNADSDGYTSLMNLIDPKTTRFKLDKFYNEAFSKKPSERSKFDEEVIAVTERFNILDQTAKGYQLKIIPIKNDPSQAWTSWIYQTKDNPIVVDTLALGMVSVYFNMVSKGMENGDWSPADKAVDYISKYQHKWGRNVIPSSTKVDIEVLYNRLNIFFYVMICYAMVGIVLLILSFVQLFSESKLLHLFINVCLGLISIIFLTQAAGLGTRWYLTGHAPWSNGYEAIVFISWVSVLAGILLYKNRNAFIPTTGAIVAVIMMGFAHGGSMLDPQITPLVPVLKSYWLIIHVAIIVSSYGFFGLGAILALFSLIIMLIKPNNKIKISLKEMTYVTEMSLTIGLYLIAVGTFLGGMWANESWGRYWSWDPKETWAFVSIIVYAVVLHMRLVPGLRGRFAFNIATLWSIWTVIMTYFGVNYYLSGLHSYAAGDPIPIPFWIPATAIGMLVLSFSAWYCQKKIYSL